MRQDMEPQQRFVMLHTFLENLRQFSGGGEWLSAFTLLGLGVAQFTTTPATSSLLVLLLGERFPGVFAVGLIVLAIVHLVCFALPSVLPMIGIRKVLSLGGLVIWASVVYDLVVRGQIGGALVFAGLAVLLWIAVWRGRYA